MLQALKELNYRMHLNATQAFKAGYAQSSSVTRPSPASLFRGCPSGASAPASEGPASSVVGSLPSTLLSSPSPLPQVPHPEPQCHPRRHLHGQQEGHREAAGLAEHRPHPVPVWPYQGQGTRELGRWTGCGQSHCRGHAGD